MTELQVALPRILHGRGAELAGLAAALADPDARAVVVSGPAGVGKTALLSETLARAAANGALTGIGKHAEGESGEDVSPFVQAMEQAVAAGMDQLYDPNAGLETLASALGGASTVFAALDSGLLRSLKGGSSTPGISAEAADERIVQACASVLRWLHGFDQPIVLQIDDWGRASERATRLYERLIADPRLPRLRLLASERPEEGSALSAGPGSTCITVGPIGVEARLAIIAEMLGQGGDGDQVLSALGAASERPFDLIHGVRALALGGGLLTRGEDWALEVRKPVAGALPESTAIRLIADQPDALAMTQMLAVFGDSADAEDLAASCGLGSAETATAIAVLETHGLARWQGRRLVLAHDRLRRAVLETLAADARRDVSVKVARALLERGASPAADPRGAIMLRHRLEAGLDDVDATIWLDLFQQGAYAARQTGDRQAADEFAEAAMTLAARVVEPSFAALREGAFAATDRADYVLAAQRADRMATVAPDAEALAESDVLRVFAKRRAGDLDGAIAVARGAVARIGVRVPTRPSLFETVVALVSVLMVSPRWALEQPMFTDEELAAAAPAMRAAHVARSLLSAQEVRLALVVGARTIPPALAARTAAGAGAYAALCAIVGRYRRAALWAGVSDLRQSQDQPIRALGKQQARSFGHWYVRPHRELRDGNDEIERLAVAEGDLAVAASAIRDRVMESLASQSPLSETIALADRALASSARFKDVALNLPHAATRQAATNLVEGGEAAWLLEGSFFSSQAFGQPADPGLSNVRSLVAILEALLAVAYGAYGAAEAIHDRWASQMGGSPFISRAQTWTFLTGVALYRQGRKPRGFALFNLRRVAKLNPTENAHRILLLDAEAARVAGRDRKAMARYAQALEAARGCSSLIEAGIVAEAAAEGAAMLGQPREAERFGEAALEAWRKLGAAGVIAARRATAAPMPDRLAEVEALKAAVRMLEQRQAERERELETARQTAERANRAKSRFLAAIGHELRTPLQGLVGLIDLAQEAGETLDARTLGSVVGQFKTVVNDLTDLSALEGGVFALAERPFDPAEACRAVVRLHEPSLAGLARAIRLATPARGVLVLGDEARVSQVLSNLIGNAVKHARGDIDVRLGVRRSGRTASITIDVADEGPGLDEAALARLFEPFERGAGTETTEGLGVGLPLSRALARRMGGDIRVTQTAGGGSSFQLAFAAPLARKPKAGAGATPTGLRVLLAEDAPLSRRVIAALLRAHGCLVEEAADGHAALNLWRADAFDLVLLDLRMPGLDGLEVAQAIRAEEAGSGRSTPIVIATAAPSVEVRAAADEMGVAAVLQKPIGWHDIAEAIGVASETPAADRPTELRQALGADAAGLFAEAAQSAATLAGEVRDAIDAGDIAAAERQAHRLAGLASNFGLSAVAGAALALEAEARRGSVSADALARLAGAASSVAEPADA